MRDGVLPPVKEAPSSPELDYPRRAGSAVAGGPWAGGALPAPN